jgi:hypothetical protein
MANKILSQGTDDNKAIVQMYVDTFEAPKKVRTHYDEPETSTVFIFNAPDCPSGGVTTYASIGVSDVPLAFKGKAQNFRLELLFAANAKEEYAANMLTTACFCIMKDRWDCFPGAVFPDVFNMYNESLSISHACFVDPFLWPSAPTTTQFQTKKVTFLQMIGITEKEYQHVEKFGYESLKNLLMLASADVLDFSRASVV